jgi:hypothetical protein
LTPGVTEDGANAEDLGHVIECIHRNLKALQLERALIVKRIGMIKQVIAGLADVFGADVIGKELRAALSRQRPAHGVNRPGPGLTDACRQTLMKSSGPLTVRQVCSRIEETNPSILARQKQPTNSVTVVLRRLMSYGEVRNCLNGQNGRAWLWIGPRARDATVGHLSPPVTGATGAASASPS